MHFINIKQCDGGLHLSVSAVNRMHQRWAYSSNLTEQIPKSSSPEELYR